MPIKVTAADPEKRRKFRGPRAGGQKDLDRKRDRERKPGGRQRLRSKPGKGLDFDVSDKTKWERWKIEQKKQSDKPVTPLGKMKKIGPKPGTQEYVQENYLLKPGYKKRKGMNIGGRANLLEEMGRIDSEKMNPNRRAEKKRVIGELNRGYKKGGLIKGKPKLAKKCWK